MSQVLVLVLALASLVLVFVLVLVVLFLVLASPVLVNITACFWKRVHFPTRQQPSASCTGHD